MWNQKFILNLFPKLSYSWASHFELRERNHVITVLQVGTYLRYLLI